MFRQQTVIGKTSCKNYHTRYRFSLIFTLL